MTDILEKVRRHKVIAIARGVSPQQLGPLAGALVTAGAPLLEVPFDQADPDRWHETVDCVRLLADQFSGRVIPGVGTVLTCRQVELAHEAGAAYVVAPNLNEVVVRRAKALGMAAIPGAMTPTEILHAWDMGADLVKLFPANMFGPDYLRMLRAPLPHIPLLAMGGIDEHSGADYLRAGAVGLGVGGRLVNPALIRAEKWDEITVSAKAFLQSLKTEA